jgi:hypothetical protein
MEVSLQHWNRRNPFPAIDVAADFAVKEHQSSKTVTERRSFNHTASISSPEKVLKSHFAMDQSRAENDSEEAVGKNVPSMSELGESSADFAAIRTCTSSETEAEKGVLSEDDKCRTPGEMDPFGENILSEDGAPQTAVEKAAQGSCQKAVCHYYAFGYCKFGNSCKNLHGPPLEHRNVLFPNWSGLWETVVSRQTSASPYCGKKVDVVTREDVVLEGSSPKTITCRVLDNVYQYLPSGTTNIPTVSDKALYLLVRPYTVLVTPL